jgi:outer membrane protein OmpA-like peptidoglycan-associated protein
VPEAQRAFQVFFDFNKSDLTGAARQVIKAAAQTAQSGHFVHLVVTGHTDTVGSARYNQGLSERRAEAVKAELVADGLPDGEITTQGVGKTGLLVPTADGVREAQNRRATIELGSNAGM